jgi:hydroxymethylglutaryl-CoA lyase
MALYDALPAEVRLMEVGPRDGLQNEKVTIDTADKLAFIDALVRAGCRRVEVTAFVNPRWIPALADHAEVAKATRQAPFVGRARYAALVPNMKGYEAAIAAGVDEVALVLAASNSHNLKNINATTEDALARYHEVSSRARADGIPFRGYISCAWGCPYEGDVDVAAVVHVARSFRDLGAYELSVGDTIGIGNPKQTAGLVRALRQELPVDVLALHLHDTRGTALANIAVALEEGVRAFDSAAGGLGGCPYAPGASGNVATEDLVFMLEAMGIRTGIDLDLLCRASMRLEQLVKRPLPSKVLAAKRASLAVA